MFIGGSYKNQAIENLIINRISKLFPDGNCSVLDVGPGYGKYGRLLQMYAKQIDAAFKQISDLNNKGWYTEESYIIK